METNNNAGATCSAISILRDIVEQFDGPGLVDDQKDALTAAHAWLHKYDPDPACCPKCSAANIRKLSWRREWICEKCDLIFLPNAESIHPESKPETVEQPSGKGLDVMPCSPCSAWVDAAQRPPISEDYGCFVHSVDLLFTDGSNQWVGYLLTLQDEEHPVWNMKGPDGWHVNNVTHWMHLPPLPNARAMTPHSTKNENDHRTKNHRTESKLPPL